MLTYHRITPPQLDRLAVGDSGTGIGLLVDAERSRRLLALQVLLDRSRHDAALTAPLPPVDEAWRLLVEAHRTAPERVTPLLGHPHVGVWTGHLLGRLRGRVDHPSPLWFHLGQFHTLAVAAAVAAGLGFRMPIPFWNGVAVLPGLGSAHLPTTGWTHADVVSDADGVRVEDREGRAVVRIGAEDDAGWRPFRVFRAPGGPDDLSISIDDASPYRGLRVPMPVDLLSDSDGDRWVELLAGAWPLLATDHADRAREIVEGLSVITPRPLVHRFRPHSASVGEGFGAAIAAEPHDPAELAAVLIHEFQHSKLNAIQHLVELWGDDPTPDSYAPWRDDPRPTGGLTHGVFAFTALAEFWAVHRERVSGREGDLAEFEFAVLRMQATRGLRGLKHRRPLTDLGRRFVAGVERRLLALRPLEVRADLLRAARLAVVDHRVGWRACHLVPDPRAVREAATAWRRGEPAPTSIARSVVTPDPRPPKLNVKGVLTRLLLADPGEFAAVGGALDERQVFPDSAAGDFALVAGEHREAAELYAAELAHGSDRPGAWSGLGLALWLRGPGPAATALLRRPEFVRAVHRLVVDTTGVPPRAGDLARWLGSAP
ncbi:HEXXH motif domain-containing protein [Saccharothrix lopnurensis]|uniref:HEXXH motif domain-containing protein n=1 Tax=Saccharothrix lopnurensis TaxID=1670621 RepID=A0ABW1P6X8_9PSEU